MSTLSELRALAEEARDYQAKSPNPWSWMQGRASNRAAAYIAAVSPDRILLLLDVAERAKLRTMKRGGVESRWTFDIEGDTTFVLVSLADLEALRSALSKLDPKEEGGR